MAETINIFSTKQSAEFVAWLTNAIVYKDENGKFRIAKRGELNKLIGERYAKNDFIGANELLESAKRTIEFTDKDMAEVVSKSVRVSSATFIRLVEFAYKNKCTLADALRYILSNWLLKELEKFEKMEGTQKKHIEYIKDIVFKWDIEHLIETFNEEVKNKEKNPTNAKYLIDIDSKELFNENRRKLLIQYWKNEFVLFGPEIFSSYIEKELNNIEFDIKIELRYDNEKLLLDLMCDTPNLLSLDDEDEIQQQFFDDTQEFFEWKLETFSNIKTAEEGYFGDTNLLFIIGNLSLKSNSGIFIDDIFLVKDEKKSLISHLLYKMPYSDSYRKYTDEDSIKKLQQEIQSAISNNELEKASELSKKLSDYQVYKGIAEWSADILLSIPKKTQVVSFTIPKITLRLIEALQEDKKLGDIIGEEIKKNQTEENKNQEEGEDKNEKEQNTEDKTNS